MGEALEGFSGLHALLGLPTAQALRERMRLGVAEIEREIVAYNCRDTDRNGLSDTDWLRYLVDEIASERPMEDGNVRDRGHAGMRLTDFVSLPMATEAGLSEAHVLALRLYTCGGVWDRINGPLLLGLGGGGQGSWPPPSAHPYAATVGHLAAALHRIRKWSTALPDGGRGGFLFRGARDFELTDELLERGGCERGFVSLLSDRLSAFKQAARGGARSLVLFKVRADNLHYLPVDVHWCSVFPRQTEFNVPIREYVLPPWTHLRPIVSLAQPRPLEETKKGPGGAEIVVRTLEVEPTWPLA